MTSGLMVEDIMYRGTIKDLIRNMVEVRKEIDNETSSSLKEAAEKSLEVAKQLTPVSARQGGSARSSWSVKKRSNKDYDLVNSTDYIQYIKPKGSKDLLIDTIDLEVKSIMEVSERSLGLSIEKIMDRIE